MIKMKQKKTVDANANIAKPSIRKVGTILGSSALAVFTVGTICVFGLTSSQVTQQDTKAAITNTTTAAVSEKKESTYTSYDTVVWRKASIGEYDISEVTTTSAPASTTVKTTASKAKTAEKTTKKDNVKMYATDIVNLRAKANKDAEQVAIIDKDDCVTITDETSDGWYTVKYGDYSGFARKEYFTKNVPESVKKSETTKKTTTTAQKKSTEKPADTTTAAKTTAKKTTTAAAAAESNDSPVISYTDEEFDMLCYVLQGEVGNCSEASKVAVANVIINRVKSSQFPNSISGVLTANNQFTAIYGYYNRTNTPSQNTIDCAKRALYGEDNTNGAIFYYAPRYCGGSTASWFESLNFCMELDGQRYFKNW